MIKVKPHLCVKQLIVSDLIVCGASYSHKSAGFTEKGEDFGV